MESYLYESIISHAFAEFIPAIASQPEAMSVSARR